MRLAIEINKDQQSILWRRHFLSDVMKSLQLHELVQEPVMNPPEANDARVKIENTNASLKWEWGTWTRVDINANHQDESIVVRSYVPFQTAEAKWRDLPAFNEVEVRFENDNGTTACAKVQVPELTSFGRDVKFDQWISGRVRVRLSEPVTAARVEVELLLLSPERTFKRQGAPVAFPHTETQIDVHVPDTFFGVIAVIAKQSRSQRLIGAADFNDYGEVIPQDVVNDRLQEVIESRNGVVHAPKQLTVEEWLRSWPEHSQRCLTALHELALQHFSNHQLTYKDEYIREQATGLLRYLTLIQCGFKSSDPGRLIGRLNNNTFQKALNAVLPTLGAALTSLRTPTEKIWAIQNARNPNLQEAVSDARNEGVAALGRALHLADKRAEAIAAWKSRQAAAANVVGSTQSKR